MWTKAEQGKCIVIIIARKKMTCSQMLDRVNERAIFCHCEPLKKPLNNRDQVFFLGRKAID